MFQMSAEDYKKGPDEVRVVRRVKGAAVQPRVVDFNELWQFYYHY